MLFLVMRTALHFYPRPPRGGRLDILPCVGCAFRISIHALREEGDGAAVALACILQLFLSTPSARRATKRKSNQKANKEISIHALREEGDNLPL